MKETRSIMKASTKTQLNRVLNLLLLLNGAFLLGTGWVMDQRLPRGQAGHGMELLGLDRHGWGDWHACLLVVAHLLLHTAWLWRVAAQTKPWKLGLGVGAAAIVVALFLVTPVTG